MKPTILLIHSQPEELYRELKKEIGMEAHIRTAVSGLDGLYDMQVLNPALVLVDSALPDLSGMSVATIIKDMETPCLVYLIGIKDTALMEHTKADRYIDVQTAWPLLCMQISTDLHPLLLPEASDSLLNAVQIQKDMLPKAIIEKMKG